MEFYPLSIVSQLLNPKDHIPIKKKPGIYLLKRGNCNAQYVGQTGRSLSTHLSEHRLAFTNEELSDAAIAKHCLEKHHHFSRLQSTLHPCYKSHIINKAEETETLGAHIASWMTSMLFSNKTLLRELYANQLNLEIAKNHQPITGYGSTIETPEINIKLGA